MNAGSFRSIILLFAWTLCCLSTLNARGESHRDRFQLADISSARFFPILPWDPQHGWSKPWIDETNGLESIAECGFNMAGFVFPRDLRRCQKLGLGAILLPSDTAFGSFDYFHQWKNLSDSQLGQRVREFVHSAGHSPAIAGFFLCDEPSVSEFASLGKAVAAVKKYAPGKLAYINLYPDYATLGAPDRSQLGASNYTEYLERFVAEVAPQCLSYDNYNVQYSFDLRDHEKAAGYFRNLLEVRRVARKHNLPCLNIVSANQIRPDLPPPSPANLLLQAYTTLAAGYRGVTWHTFYGRGYRYASIGLDGNKTPTWEWLREVNRQIATLAPVMSELRSTGVFFSSAAFRAGLPQLPGELVGAVASEVPMMVGEFSGPGGARYAMIVNLSLERSEKLTIQLRRQETGVEMISSVDGKQRPFSLAKDELWLNAGQGLLFRVKVRRE